MIIERRYIGFYIFPFVLVRLMIVDKNYSDFILIPGDGDEIHVI